VSCPLMNPLWTMEDTYNIWSLSTLRYLYLKLRFLVFFLGCPFSFLDLLGESCGNNAANNNNRTDRSMYKLILTFLLCIDYSTTNTILLLGSTSTVGQLWPGQSIEQQASKWSLFVIAHTCSVLLGMVSLVLPFDSSLLLVR
jgi:hypothetical protein